MSPANLLDVAVDLEEMGRRMEHALERSGLSVSKLSYRTEIDTTLLRRYIKGLTEPGATRLAKIAEALDVSTDYLLQTTHDPAKMPWDGKERRSTPPSSGGVPLEEMRPKPRQHRSRSA